MSRDRLSKLGPLIPGLYRSFMETERYKLDEQLHLSESYRRVALLGENSTTVANPLECD